MKANNTIIADDVVVTMEYLLTLEDGEEIDRSDGRDPFQFLHGHGQIIPGLERELYGMKVGDKKEVTVVPGDGYGEFDPDGFNTVPRTMFPADMELEEGQSLQLRDADSGEIFQASVSELDGDKVVLDFNHPLAGETLIFQIKIADLRAATNEELAHGHVHSPGHHH